MSRASRRPNARRVDARESDFRERAKSLPVVSYVAALDVQGAFTYMSPQVERILGYAADEWTRGRGLWLERMHPEDLARLLPGLVRAHRDGAPFSAEYRLRDRRGAWRWIRDESVLVHDEEKRPLCIRGTWTEITDAKTGAAKAVKLSRALASSRSDLAQFVSAASHELKAPLRRIVNLAGLLDARAGAALDAESRELLERMRASAETMQGLVAGLADYAETEVPAAPVPVDAEEALRAALRSLGAEIGASGAEVTYGDLPCVRAEAEPLRRVFSELVGNALKFRRPETPRVHVSARSTLESAEFLVRDNGIGIAHGQTESVFGLFGRVDPRAHAGRGIGLAVCRKIVERLGGRIWVVSEPGEGSTFHFTLRPAPEKP
ncbi:MAG: ATP-binding protein [Elusimicrobiota bacterium]|nr:MAG: ATP-binding protein [Elusimicrobiota bacterium]